jgi:hypothetical protein
MRAGPPPSPAARRSDRLVVAEQRERVLGGALAVAL